MAGTTTRRVRDQAFDFTSVTIGGGVAAGDWTAPQQVTDLADSGLLSRGTLRAPAGSTLTGAEIKVFRGVGYTVATNAQDVPDEHVVWHETAIVVAGHATTADADVNILHDRSGAPYDIRRDTENMWVSLRTTVTTGAQTGITLTLEAIDTL